MTRSVSMNAASGHADRVASGSGTVGSNELIGVVGEHAHGAADEARHVRQWRHPAARHEAAQRLERIGGRRHLGDELRRVLDADGSGAGDGLAVANFEEAARQDAQEGIAAQALAALDRLEQVGGRAVVEREEGADRSLEVRVARGAQQHGVVVGGEALGLGCVRSALR